MNLNKAFIVGNLTRDPELRQTPTGQTVCSFGVATNRMFTDSAGQRQKQAEFHNIVAWGRQAEIVNQYLRKGSLVLVEGRIQTRSWQDPQGQKHWKTEIIAERIQLGPRSSGSSYDANEPHDTRSPMRAAQESSPASATQNPPIIELPDDGEEIDIKDIPF